MSFARIWNSDKEIRGNLAKAGFTATIVYGYQDEDRPRGVLIVENGKVTVAGEYTSQKPNWDLRADLEHWQRWIMGGFGLVNLGTAAATGQLKFIEGDYRQMVRDARLASPFLKHFELMTKVKTEFRK
ncbi:MAG: hypothetical protein BMS9Abin36_1333 [Gammaproteobacteria bacterium]|nr:MAG: hypothetical protein BMS9Abin36_1333 [Gammaproteobacteria bacterium]